MGRIAILPDILASQVAAGEVVERPASVVKELVENALDAGARHVEVEIAKGGASLVKITDDGSGMSREDALMCLERHATSKLRDSKGLTTISTMGFRGEAVPSIASVSKLRLLTREHGSVEGTELVVDGGVVRDVKAVGMQGGSVFEIRNLFFNVPARRKFLKTETTESAHVEHQVRLHALAWPEVRFTFRKDGRTVFDLPGTGDRRMRIQGLNAGEVGRALREVGELEDGGMAISGYVLPSDFARKGRRQQFVFLNGRPIEDPAISRAMRDGFKGAVAEGLNPAGWLWMEMDPMLVDVNVHPAKREVRFHRPYDVRALVCRAIEGAFAEGQETVARGVAKIVSRKDGTERMIPQRSNSVAEPPKAKPESRVENDGNDCSGNEARNGESERRPTPDFGKGSGAVAVGGSTQMSPPVFARKEAAAEQVDFLGTERVGEVPDFRLLGVLHERYYLMEGEEGLVLLDPKSARERIVYEGLMEGGQGGFLESQALLMPELLELDVRDLDTVMTNLENFTEAGFDLEPFGGGTLQVRSLPTLLGEKDPRSFMTAMVDELVETAGSKRGKLMAYEVFAGKVAKRAAWNESCRAGGFEELLRELFDCDLPYCAPDGRPTLIQISLKELERKFG